MNKIITFISPDIEHRYIRKLGEEYLNIEFTKDYDAIRNSSKSMILWNPYGYLAHKKETYKRKYELYKEMLEKKKDVYVVERGALPNTIFIEKNYFNVESDSYRENKWNRELTQEENKNVENYIHWLRHDEHTLEPQNNDRLNSISDLYTSLDIDKSKYKQVAFVPLQIHNDTVTILWCDWTENTTQFVEYIKNLAKLNEDTLFLIKNHPCEEDNYKVKCEYSNFKIVDSFHYKDCLEACDKVITINSGLGLQAMCWEKPVAICGKAFYHFNDINLKIDNFSQLQTFLDFDWSINYEKVKRFIHYLITEFYTECTMQKISRNASVPKLIKSVRLPKDCYIEQTKSDTDLKILYLFNEYGWAFDFEARNYAKYSRHNVVPFHYNPLDFDLHESDYHRIISESPDIIVIPSAWHYYKINRSYIEKLKEKNIRIAVQYNSHYEPKYFCKHADLVMCSSQKLYEEVTSKYQYDNIIKQLHFVDTSLFQEMSLDRYCQLGWTGRFDNPVKRTNILLQLGYPILIKGNYHNFLNLNRSHSEMIDFYKNISILLVTSQHEGSPYPLLEAMSCGRVVLSTDVGIASEVLEKDFIIRSQKESDIIKKFQQKINSLYQSPIKMFKNGVRNSEYIRRYLSWKDKYIILDNIYEELSRSPIKKHENKLIYGDKTFRELLIYLLDHNISFWLVKDSCLDAIRYCTLKLQPNVLHLASDKHTIKKLSKLFKRKDWYKNNYTFYKENKTIRLYEEEERPVKKMTLFGLDVNVPYPVVNYLVDLYGTEWRQYGISQ